MQIFLSHFYIDANDANDLNYKHGMLHKCSWITVYVFCRNAQSKPHSDPRDVCMLSLLYQLPNCNLFTQNVLFILWRDTTSELWTPVQFPLHCYTVLPLLALFTYLQTIIQLPLDTLIPLFTANR
jgi:hypothetical protein